MDKAMKVAPSMERLPRWKDCLVFAVVGLTILIVALLAKGSDAAMWFGVRWGGLTASLCMVTAFRRRNGR
ncbi:hypothetical protein [Paraburkholderia phytofirmans]|uniref:Transmembrane protein n=1 Tax=Paraburkholderia phytofirmans (strain DSM 17436 / LMG 22146 / PsJN) TaxID=398527 RepID=B2TH15_PARPJ|nr:hypothetical protein [Paraburkholderia phytofirmans]ACD21564.1 hypothetical protein Bphyt_7279 [Paraburkholderia phytofirmans PsJN]